MPFIEVHNLSKTFSDKKPDSRPVFENLQFQIELGEFVTFLGPSGCGKSTLLRILGELETASHGILKSQSSKKSFVFQEPRLLLWRNCLENTVLPIEIQNSRVSDEDLERAKNLLKLFKLENSFDQYPHQLSGGMKMRNALARSLIVSPDFLLLDEPFAALDETTRLFLQTELRSLYEKRKWTVAFVTHSIEEACFLSNRIFLFSKNRKSLIEHKSSLPAERTHQLRDQLSFFEEIKTVRHLFEKESLS